MADFVKFVHNGCYTARFVATWNETHKDEHGSEQTTQKSYHSDSVDTNYIHTLSSDAKITNLSVSIESCTGLSFDMWKRISDARNIPTDVCTTFTTSGSEVNPKVTITPPIEHVSHHIL